MFLGYVLATSALMSGRQKESTLVAILVPMIALGVPLTDTLFTMVRRFLARRPIFSPDRGHIHHRLLDLGLTHRRVVLLLYTATIGTCAMAMVAAFGKDWQVGGALFAAAVIVLGSARFAGYFQTKVLRERVAPNAEVDRMRHWIPSMVLASQHAGHREILESLRESVLEPGGFMRVEITDPARPWTWQRDAAAPRPAGAYDVDYEVEVGSTGVLRCIVKTDEKDASPQLEMLLQLLGDSLASAADQQSSSVRSRSAGQGDVQGDVQGAEVTAL
jgi:UDP-GlcNAc:undecaprenyl-phosphate/decaprenyl-phosphate GlcNAc-1-phosphate transferase